MEHLVAMPVQAKFPLNIHLSEGTGEGPTPLAAFDAALMDAGVANYNFLCLSSVIPPNARIVVAKHHTQPDDYGRRLYVVMSQARQCLSNQYAHAGIGWVQEAGNGRGLFVELHDDNRERLEQDLHTTLEAMRHYREVEYGPVQSKISSRLCTASPVCALVVAVYACESW